MIAKKEDSEPTAEQPLPNSRKVYVVGQHVDLRIPYSVIPSREEKRIRQDLQD